MGLGVAVWAGWIAAIDPTWETPDDPVAAMGLLGWGVAAQGLVYYPFGGLAWAWLVHGLAPWLGVVSYGVAILAALGVAAAGAWVALRYATLPALGAWALAVLLFARPLAQPQFTVLAGMAAVAGVLLLAVAPGAGAGWSRLGGWGLLLTGACLRPMEAALVAALATPWLPWRAWVGDARERGWVLGAAALLACGGALDAWVHADPAWAARQAYAASLALPVCDYHVGPYLAARPEVLAAHGASANDLALLAAYFHADPAVNALGGLRWGERGMAWGAYLQGNMALLPESLGVWTHRPLWPLLAVLGVGGLLAGRGRRRLLVGLVLLGGACLALVALGRPMPPRVAFAPVALLAACAVLEACRALTPEAAGRRVLVGVLVLAAGAALTLEGRARLAREPQLREARALVMQLDPAVRHLVWADFPFHHAYRVLEREPQLLARRYTPLGWPCVLPNVAAADRDGLGRSWWQRLQAGEPVRLVATPAHVALLATYAREHAGRALVARPLGSPVVHELRLGRGPLR